MDQRIEIMIGLSPEDSSLTGLKQNRNALRWP
jgi:hypothetical protein